jgi:hypothetical protein
LGGGGGADQSQSRATCRVHYDSCSVNGIDWLTVKRFGEAADREGALGTGGIVVYHKVACAFLKVIYVKT